MLCPTISESRKNVYFAIEHHLIKTGLGLTRASDFLCHLIGHVQISKRFAHLEYKICENLAISWKESQSHILFLKSLRN